MKRYRTQYAEVVQNAVLGSVPRASRISAPRVECRPQTSLLWRVQKTDLGSAIDSGLIYPVNGIVGRMYKDARVSRIYGGANETMKVVIARSL